MTKHEVKFGKSTKIENNLVNDVCAAKSLRKEVTVKNVANIKRYTNVAVDDKHKLLYCYVPKVGCTSLEGEISTHE